MAGVGVVEGWLAKKRRNGEESRSSMESSPPWSQPSMVPILHLIRLRSRSVIRAKQSSLPEACRRLALLEYMRQLSKVPGRHHPTEPCIKITTCPQSAHIAGAGTTAIDAKEICQGECWIYHECPSSTSRRQSLAPGHPTSRNEVDL